MRLYFDVALLILVNYKHLIVAYQNEFKLELLQVLFRHGDRSADEEEVYETDPYAETFKRLGYGQLTIAGKQREYKIGQILRDRYDHFLGDFDVTGVYAYSTDDDRTKMSLDLVLAGLYPPTCETLWNEKILWSPIPTYHNSTDNDFFESYYDCPSYKEMHRKAEQSNEVQSALKENQDFLDYVKRSTGIKKFKTSTIFDLHNDLRAALSLGLPLPDWCSKDDYAKIKELSRFKYVTMTFTNALLRLTTGRAIEKFLSNINDHDNDASKEMKIYLYCAHDYNIATFNIAHNFTNTPILPDYGSTIVIEKLRDLDDRVYLRMFMWTGASEEWIPLKLQSCGVPCPLKDYTNLIKWVLPDDESKKCDSASSSCKK